MTRRRSRTLARTFSFSRYRRQSGWLVVILAAWILLRWWGGSIRPRPPESLEEGTHQVRRVVDGDTLLLDNRARVRLIGADTPETVKPDHPVESWGPEATQFTEQFVAGREIRLQFDGPRKDKCGRFLAYVWVGDRMLNEELIREGLAKARTEFSYAESMKARFDAAEARARAAGRGMWSR